MLLLCEHQLAPGRAQRIDERDGRDLVACASCRQQRDGAAFSMSDERNAFRVDVVAFAEPLNDLHCIVGVILERRGLGAAAALADAAFVVADHEVSGFRQIA